MSDRLLPMTNTSKVAKSALPEGSIMSKDVKKIFNQAGSIFIMYIATIAGEIAKENQGKKKKALISSEIIIQALEEMEFRNIAQTLKKP